ncbi:MAG: hypothetical protein SWH61_14505 [Thermodesulfobacteriota bacterium]|nr:hypothetical protein [Thermodesulfobacteriota bacterium]
MYNRLGIGGVKAMTLGNGMNLSVAYDARFREINRQYLSGTTVCYEHTVIGDGLSIPGYDDNSNIRREVIDYDGLAQATIREYTYDNRNRLTDMDQPDSGQNALLWRYDDVGNWVETNQNGETENRTPNADNEYTGID